MKTLIAERNLSNYTRREHTLKLGVDISAEETARSLNNWNTVLAVSYPGNGFYESLPEVEMEGNTMVQKFALYADDEFWDAFNGLASNDSPDYEEIEIADLAYAG